jgi:peptidoglycan/LPS O-acetylase OafA/YrhL
MEQSLSVPERDSYKRTYRPDIFVISGYLIGGHIFYELLTSRFSYLQFYRRRAKRILPAFYVVLAFSILAALILLSPFEVVDFGRYAMAATLSASNILLGREAGNYFAAKNELNPMLMTWSLGVEEQFYAVIPVLMVLLARIRRSFLLLAIIAVCILSFLYACYEIKSQPQAAFYSLPARAWELGIGIALAVAELNKKRSLLSKPLAQWVSLTGIALMLCPMAMLTKASLLPGAAALPSVLGTALVIAVPASWINRYLLSLPPLVFIGRISYSWYLWHWPILSFFRIISGGSLPRAAVALAIAASLGAAIATYYVIEQPFRRSSRAAAPLLFRYAIVSLVAFAVCVSIWSSRGISERYPKLAKTEEANENLDLALASDPCMLSWDKDNPNLSQACYDASGAHRVVALWGDSHAGALASALRNSADAQLYGFAQFTRSGCPPLIGASMYYAGRPFSGNESCFVYNRKVANLLNNTHTIQIVILAASWTAPFMKAQPHWLVSEFALNHERLPLDAERALFMYSLAATVQSLTANGKQVIVMNDVPRFDFDPFWKLRSSQIPIRYTIASWMGVQDTRDTGFALPQDSSSEALATFLLQKTLAAFPEATLVDLKRALCNEAGQCAYRKGNKLLYFDSDHLTIEGARYALRDFRLPPAATMNGGS